MPRKVTNEEAMQEVPLDAGVIRAERPIIQCKIVYLGAMKNKSLALPGRIVTETFERQGEAPQVVKSVSDSGMTCYDFSTHGIDGRLITERQMPDSAAAHLRGRQYVTCEHIEHLQAFFLLKGADGEREFEVLAKPEDRATIQEHIRRSMRSRRQQEALFQEVLG